MKSFISKFITAWSFVSLTCLAVPSQSSEADLLRAIATLTTSGTFTYSSATLPVGWGPPDSTMTFFQAPGMRVYFCQTPAGTGDTSVAAALVLNNRFGSRYCNHHHGQLILNIATQHISNTCLTNWTQYLTNNAVAQTKFSIIPISSGYCFYINAPSANLAKVIAAFKQIMSDLYLIAVTATQVDTLCTQLQTDINTAIAANSGFGTLQLLGNAMVLPQWDCVGNTTIGSIATNYGIPLGSVPSYAKSRLSLTSGTVTGRQQVKLALDLIKNEKDITIFLASSDTTLLSQIPTQMQTLVALNPAYVKAYSKTYFGHVVPRGGSFSYTFPGDTNNTTGGVIFLGKICPESVVAAAMIMKLISDNLVTTGSYSGTNSLAMIPEAGQMTVRLSSAQGAAAVASNNWDVFIPLVKARYNNNANTADFSNAAFLALIDQAYNHFRLGAFRTNFTTDSSNASNVLTATNEGNLNWIMLFQGSLNTLSNLNKSRIRSVQDRALLLQNAAALIVAAADQTVTCEFNYLKS